ncbi:MAG: hypothetical protein HY606_08700 [Planctomycetes bacterium]|nr:hypothetical protein [Planctomycetota bacterium]
MNELEKLESEKLKLINDYMKMQDIVDDYNDKIYKVCVQIELINKRISVIKEKESKKSLASAGPANQSKETKEINVESSERTKQEQI